MEYIRTEPTSTDNNRSSLKFAYGTGQFKQFQRLFERYGFHTLIRWELREAGLVIIISRANLHHRPESAYLHEHGLAACRIGAKLTFARFMLAARVHHLIYNRLEIFIEALHHGLPFGFTFGYTVEFFLYIRRKIIVHNLRKVLYKKVVHHGSYIRRQELSLLIARHFLFVARGYLCSFERIDGISTLLAFLVAFLYIFSLLDSADRRSIRRRTTYTEFFQFMYQTGFGIAYRTL